MTALLRDRRRATPRRRDPRDPRDNSFGRGYYPLPNRLLGLGRYVDNLRPQNIVSTRVYLEDGVWLLTTRADTRLSIMKLDMESLLRAGLIRIQVNEPGTITFYIQDKPVPRAPSQPIDPVVPFIAGEEHDSVW